MRRATRHAAGAILFLLGIGISGAAGLESGPADRLYAAIFPPDGAVRPPYLPVLYDLQLDPAAATRLVDQAVQRAEALEVLWREHGGALPPERRGLVAYAFGLGHPDTVLRSASAWPAAVRYDLARLLIVEGRTAAAVTLAQGLLQGSWRRQAAGLIAGCARRRTILSEHLPLQSLDPDPVALRRGLDQAGDLQRFLAAIDAQPMPPVAPRLDSDGLTPLTVTHRREWHWHQSYAFEEAILSLSTTPALPAQFEVMDQSLDGEVPGLRVLRRDRNWPRDGRIVVDIDTAFFGPLYFELIRIDDERDWTRATPAVVAAGRVLRRWYRQWLPLAANNRMGRRKQYEVLEDVTAGRYVLLVQARYAPAVAVLPLAVSRVGLLAVGDAAQLSLMAVDRRDSRPLVGLSLLHDGVELATDAQGMLQLPFPDADSRLTVTGDPVGWHAPSPPAVSERTHDLAVWCNRPLLRAGEALVIRALPRHLVDGTLQVYPTGSRLRAELVARGGDTTIAQELQVDDRGVLAWDLVLPPAADAGRYDFHLPGLDLHEQLVHYADYRLPPIALRAGLSYSQSRWHGEPLSLSFAVERIDGRPVVGARISCSMTLPDERSVEFVAVTEADGTCAITWSPPAGMTGRITGTAVAEAAVGRSEVKDFKIDLVDQAFRFRVHWDMSRRKNPTLGSAYQVRLQQNHWDGRRLESYRISCPDLPAGPWPGDGEETLSIDLPTHELGPHEFVFTCRHAGESVVTRWRYTVRPPREQHLAAAGCQTMTVGEQVAPAVFSRWPEQAQIDERRSLGFGLFLRFHDYNTQRFPRTHIQNHQTYKHYAPLRVGQRLPVKIFVDRHTEDNDQAVAVLLTVANRAIRTQRRLLLTPGEHRLELPVARDWCPGVQVSLHGYDGDDVVDDRRCFRVEDPTALLDLRLELPHQRYLPGQALAAGLTIRDGAGRPAAGVRCSLRLLDCAVQEYEYTDWWAFPPHTQRWRRWIPDRLVVQRDEVPDWPEPRLHFLDGFRRWLGRSSLAAARHGCSGSAGRTAADPLASDDDVLVCWRDGLYSDAQGRVPIDLATPHESGAWLLTVTAVGPRGAFGSATADFVTVSAEGRN